MGLSGHFDHAHKISEAAGELVDFVYDHDVDVFDLSFNNQRLQPSSQILANEKTAIIVSCV